MSDPVVNLCGCCGHGPGTPCCLFYGKGSSKNWNIIFDDDVYAPSGHFLFPAGVYEVKQATVPTLPPAEGACCCINAKNMSLPGGWTVSIVLCQNIPRFWVWVFAKHGSGPVQTIGWYNDDEPQTGHGSKGFTSAIDLTTVNVHAVSIDPPSGCGRGCFPACYDPPTTWTVTISGVPSECYGDVDINGSHTLYGIYTCPFYGYFKSLPSPGSIWGIGLFTVPGIVVVRAATPNGAVFDWRFYQIDCYGPSEGNYQYYSFMPEGCTDADQASIPSITLTPGDTRISPPNGSPGKVCACQSDDYTQGVAISPQLTLTVEDLSGTCGSLGGDYDLRLWETPNGLPFWRASKVICTDTEFFGTPFDFTVYVSCSCGWTSGEGFSFGCSFSTNLDPGGFGYPVAWGTAGGTPTVSGPPLHYEATGPTGYTFFAGDWTLCGCQLTQTGFGALSNFGNLKLTIDDGMGMAFAATATTPSPSSAPSADVGKAPSSRILDAGTKQPCGCGKKVRQEPKRLRPPSNQDGQQALGSLLGLPDRLGDPDAGVTLQRSPGAVLLAS